MFNTTLQEDKGYSRWLKRQPAIKSHSFFEAFKKAIEKGEFIFPKFDNNLAEELQKYKWPYKPGGRIPVFMETTNFPINIHKGNILEDLGQSDRRYWRHPYSSGMEHTFLFMNEADTIFPNKQNVNTSMNPNTKVETTAGAVVDAAKKCSTANTILRILFPSVFDDSERDAEHFCTVGQLIKRKGYDHDYAVIMVQKGIFQMVNISQHKFWSYCRKSANELKVGQNGTLSRGQFKLLIADVSFKIDEFTPQ